MIKILDFNLFPVILCLMVVVIITYHFIEKLISAVIRKLKINDGEMKILISKSALIIFNIFIMLIFKIRIKELLLLKNFNTGVIWLLVGIGFSILISVLICRLMRESSNGGNYTGMIKGSPAYMFITLLLLVGPAEDLLYIGVVQHTLMGKIQWVAVPVYIVIFTLCHYVNVLKGAESKKEFLEMLPIRLIVSFILSMAFYTTGSLIYGFIIHNIFDTLCFLGILIGTKSNQNLQA